MHFKQLNRYLHTKASSWKDFPHSIALMYIMAIRKSPGSKSAVNQYVLGGPVVYEDEYQCLDIIKIADA